MRLFDNGYVQLIKISIRRMMEYRVFFFMMAIRLVIELTVLYFFWSAVYNNSIMKEINGYTFSEMFSYMILSLATLTLFKNSIDVTISEKVKVGVISLDLMKPMHFQSYHFFLTIGMVMFRFIFQTVPILVLANLFFKNQIFVNGSQFFFYMLSTVFGFICMFFIDYIIGLSSFWLLNNWGMTLAKETIVYLFSGGIIPLAFFNKPLRLVADMLPFKAVIHIPLQIGMSNFTADQVFHALLFQLMWIVLLFILSIIVWNSAQAKISIQGG